MQFIITYEDRLKINGYKDVLLTSYKTILESHDYDGVDEYLSSMFGLTTYDSGLDELFVPVIIDVMRSITYIKTFEYHGESRENYVQFILVCNIPFVSEKISWGTSIRGAFWSVPNCNWNESPVKETFIELDGIHFFDRNGEQFKDNLEFSRDEWALFTVAIDEFYQENKQDDN